MNDASAARQETASAGALRGAIGRLGYFTLAFGAIVGSGWIVVLGDWLNAAGPAGVVTGLALGGISMVCVGLCYGELAARYSSAGGEFLYVVRDLGRFAGFLVGWFLTLYAIAVCAFEAVVLAWLLRTLLPGIISPYAYAVGSSSVTLDALLIGTGGAVAIGYLHYRGAASAIRFQNLITLTFIAVMAVLIACGALFGSSQHLQPLFPSRSTASIAGGILWVFSSSTFFLNGWQTSLHAIEERRPGITVKVAVLFMAAGILLSALFYCSVMLAAGAAVPWQTLIRMDMPAVGAFSALLPKGILGTAIMCAAIISLLKTWSAVTWIASRLIVAQAREGFLPRRLAKCDPASGSPRAAILLVIAFTLIGPLMGRSALLPIVDMVSICLAFSIVLCLIVLLRRRRSDRSTPSYTVPGGTPTIVFALVAVLLMIAVSILKPLIDARGTVPPEWCLLGAWTLLGIGTWLLRRRRGIAGE